MISVVEITPNCIDRFLNTPDNARRAALARTQPVNHRSTTLRFGFEAEVQEQYYCTVVSMDFQYTLPEIFD